MYLALYRKYRPRTFDDVISQEHITTTLKNQVISGNTAHAYLFTGSRGTGKTTCAKILAMAVNCEHPKNGNPCLECERCREILNGTTTDIVEMDAASNNGVDDVRQLRDEVNYTPVSCKYHVYIIDEAHMLSPAAFNALLKTLEEPPPHVKFILATTEVHKVLATISSRCQRFEFRRVDIADSAKRLLWVAGQEHVNLTQDAAELIARLSDGGMRDALSILDRCASAGDDITSQVVRDCAGVADTKHLFEFSEMIAKRDTAGCIRLLGELYRGARDISLIIDELSTHFRDIMLCKTAPEDKELLTALPDEYPELERITGMYSLAEILRCLTLLQQCADGLGKVKQRKTLAEMCFVKMCSGESAASTAVERAPVKKPEPVVYAEQKPVVAEPPKVPSTPAEKAIADKTRALFEETEKRAREAAKAAEISKASGQPAKPADIPFEAPPPEPPGFPEPPDFPEPPEESFWGDSYPINTEDAQPKKTAKAVKEVKEPKEPKKPKVSKEPKEPEVKEVTAEQWNEAVSRMDVLTASMFAGSQAKVKDGLVEITTSNKMLLDNVKGDEVARVEGIVSNALGFPVRISIKSADNVKAEDKDETPLNRLLSRASQKGVDIITKD